MSNSPYLLKGALIYFHAPMLVPVPDIVVFQYNPESMTRAFTPWMAPSKDIVPELKKDLNSDHEGQLRSYGETLARLSQPYDPAETFSLVLEFDAADLLEFPELNPTAVAVGVADRLAAIEMLLYPPGDSLTAGLLTPEQATLAPGPDGKIGADSIAASREILKQLDAPIVLFFWGPGRIVPVRIQSLQIEEQQYSAQLYPVRAKASIGLRVLDLDDLTQLSGDTATGAAADLARACYRYTLAQKRGLALASLANPANALNLVRGAASNVLGLI